MSSKLSAEAYSDFCLFWSRIHIQWPLNLSYDMLMIEKPQKLYKCHDTDMMYLIIVMGPGYGFTIHLFEDRMFISNKSKKPLANKCMYLEEKTPEAHGMAQTALPWKSAVICNF